MCLERDKGIGTPAAFLAVLWRYEAVLRWALEGRSECLCGCVAEGMMLRNAAKPEGALLCNGAGKGVAGARCEGRGWSAGKEIAGAQCEDRGAESARIVGMTRNYRYRRVHRQEGSSADGVLGRYAMRNGMGKSAAVAMCGGVVCEGVPWNDGDSIQDAQTPDGWHGGKGQPKCN